MHGRSETFSKFMRKTLFMTFDKCELTGEINKNTD